MTIGGMVKPGFEHVREVFEQNFEIRGEVGAACAAVVDCLSPAFGTTD